MKKVRFTIDGTAQDFAFALDIAAAAIDRPTAKEHENMAFSARNDCHISGRKPIRSPAPVLAVTFEIENWQPATWR